MRLELFTYKVENSKRTPKLLVTIGRMIEFYNICFVSDSSERIELVLFSGLSYRISLVFIALLKS